MKQLIALVASACLILGAWVLTRSGDGSSGDDAAEFTIICSTEAEEFCLDSGVEGILETPGETLARLTDAEADELESTLWVVSDPWPALLVEARERESLRTDRASVALGSADVGVAGRAATMEELTAACQDPMTWGCLSSEQGASWTSIGVPATATTAGLLGVVGIANGELGPGDYATNDLGDPAFSESLEAIKSADGNQATEIDPFTKLVTQRGTYDLALGLALADAIDELADSTSFRSAIPEPAVQARLVIDHPSSIDDEAASAALGDPKDLDGWLNASGWDTNATAPSETIPGPGVVAALVEKWDNLQ